MAELKRHKGELLLAEEEKRRIQHLFSEQVDHYLDSGYGECHLKHPEIAQSIVGAFERFNGERYYLHAWCVMPNHVHVIVEPVFGHDLSKIVHSWKSYTAHVANKVLGRSGSFWMCDAYNHIIRSERAYEFQRAYVWENPDKAGLKDWKWRWKLEPLTQIPSFS